MKGLFSQKSVNDNVSSTHDLQVVQGCREWWFAYASDENTRYSLCSLKYKDIGLFCIKITLSIPYRLTEEVYEGVTDYPCDNQLQTTHRNAFSQGFFRL